MKLISDIKDIKIQKPNYFNLKPSSSDEEIYLWEVGYQYLCSIEDSIHVLKDMIKNENIKVTDEVYRYLLSNGERINDSY